MPNGSSSLLTVLSNDLAGLIDRVAPSLVTVHGRRRQSSSGFMWRAGLAVTADEALEDDDDIPLTLPDGVKAAARLVGRDPSTDIALLRIEHQAVPVLSLSGTEGCRPGQLSLAVGRRPEGPGAACGIISLAGAPWQSLRGGRIDRRLELDLRLDPRSEGGVALDAEGHIIGMTVHGPRNRVLVIPSETIERVAQQLADHGRIARGYIGLGLQPVRIDRAAASEQGSAPSRGLMVVSVDPEGPGKSAGLMQGDVIVDWNGEAIRHVRDLYRRLGPDSVGQSTGLGILRAGDRLELTVQIGERAMPR